MAKKERPQKLKTTVIRRDHRELLNILSIPYKYPFPKVKKVWEFLKRSPPGESRVALLEDLLGLWHFLPEPGVPFADEEIDVEEGELERARHLIDFLHNNQQIMLDPFHLNDPMLVARQIEKDLEVVLKEVGENGVVLFLTKLLSHPDVPLARVFLNGIPMSDDYLRVTSVEETLELLHQHHVLLKKRSKEYKQLAHLMIGREVDAEVVGKWLLQFTRRPELLLTLLVEAFRIHARQVYQHTKEIEAYDRYEVALAQKEQEDADEQIGTRVENEPLPGQGLGDYFTLSNPWGEVRWGNIPASRCPLPRGAKKGH